MTNKLLTDEEICELLEWKFDNSLGWSGKWITPGGQSTITPNFNSSDEQQKWLWPWLIKKYHIDTITIYYEDNGAKCVLEGILSHAYANDKVPAMAFRKAFDNLVIRLYTIHKYLGDSNEN